MCWWAWEGYVRAEVSPLAGDDGDDDIVHLGDLVEQLGDAEVTGHVHGVELLLGVQGDDGDFAALLHQDCRLRVEVGHGLVVMWSGVEV